MSKWCISVQPYHLIILYPSNHSLLNICSPFKNPLTKHICFFNPNIFTAPAIPHSRCHFFLSIFLAATQRHLGAMRGWGSLRHSTPRSASWGGLGLQRHGHDATGAAEIHEQRAQAEQVWLSIGWCHQSRPPSCRREPAGATSRRHRGSGPRPVVQWRRSRR